MQAGAALGMMTVEARRGHAAYLRDHQRVFTANGYVDQVMWHPTNGLLQGDPLSVLLCVSCVAQWLSTVIPTGVAACAYVDDRTLHTRDPRALEKAWDASQAWDRQHGWRVNYGKMAYVCQGRDQAYLPTPDGPLLSQKATCLLGSDLLAGGTFACERQARRVRVVHTTADRIARLPLTPWTLQQLVSIVLLPRLACGPHMRMLSVHHTRLRAQVKRAMHVDGRAHSWPMLTVCVHPVHRVDPQN